ncbi:MAG: molybdopterin molybdotransferase MoeA [Promethearchaeota archaeon]
MTRITMDYLKALLFDDFRSRVLAGQVEIKETERVLVGDALHRVCAVDVKSVVDVPHFRRAMRDGYAVRARDTFGATEDDPLEFRLVEEVPAGAVPSREIGERECSYVATGSMMPQNADGVVMVEYSDLTGDGGGVLLKQAIPPDTHVIPVGKDIRKQETVLPEGTFLTGVKLGVLAAVGLSEVEVYRKPRVGILSTGDEVLDPAEPLAPGKVYNINTITLANSIVQSGGVVTDYGIVRDDIGELERVLQRMLREQDVVISSGGTSKGKGDHMPRLLSGSPSVSLFVHGIRMKPGKPIIYARWRWEGVEKPVFVLPGYPTSCMMTYLFIVDPLVRELARHPPLELKTREATLASRVYSELGRREFKAVKLRRGDSGGESYADPLPTGSESITTLASADGVFVVDEMRSIVEEGETVEVYLLP